MAWTGLVITYQEGIITNITRDFVFKVLEEEEGQDGTEGDGLEVGEASDLDLAV